MASNRDGFLSKHCIRLERKAAPEFPGAWCAPMVMAVCGASGHRAARDTA
jgi:hypothetical protein